MAEDGWGSSKFNNQQIQKFVLGAINDQSDSLVEVIQLLAADDGDPMVFINAVLVWSDKDTGERNMDIIDSWIETGDFSNVFMLTVDWYEVLYEYEIWSKK
ncbi:hypothetical protein LCGC14_1441120 [marine sediment metagenome]|uniref:Uncharacterized protein n=1 Tax=marine sediment metagenome TaxID=412755 RepID=A0A0F9MML3_9ZZZZ